MLTVTQLFKTGPGPELDAYAREALESLGAILPRTWEPSKRVADAFDLVSYAETFLLFKNSGNPQWPEGSFVCAMVDVNGRIEALMAEKRPATNHEANKIIQSVAKYQIAAPTAALAMCWAFLFARIVDAQKMEAIKEYPTMQGNSFVDYASEKKLEVVKRSGLIVPRVS